MPKYRKIIISDHCSKRQSEREVTRRQIIKCLEDPIIEAIYIKLRDGKVSKSEELGPNGEAIVDLDKSGNVIGIEMLEPGKITVRLFNKIRKQFKIKDLNNFKIDRPQQAFA